MDNTNSLKLVLCDGQSISGDNAEYFYRKARVLYPSLQMNYLLSQKSPDWNRLKQDGFNLCALEKSEANSAIYNSDFVLLSKFMPRVYNREKTIFLQHGTTAEIYNDSIYLSSSIASRAKYICCQSESEANLLRKYTQNKSTPILTGMPRRDILLEKNQEYQATNHPKQVFISFHWRQGILDNSENIFRCSSYFKKINELLNSKQLKDLHDQGVKIVFLPHARFMKYKDLFKRPSCVELATKPFQDNLVESDILITDFSSNSFEMAYMNKPTICYIPDEQYVKTKLRHYRIENISKYPHMFRCMNIDQIAKNLDEFLQDGNKFDFAKQMFDYVDTDSTKRLVEWMFSHKLEKTNRDVKIASNQKENKRKVDYFAKNLARFRFG